MSYLMKYVYKCGNRSFKITLVMLLKQVNFQYIPGDIYTSDHKFHE